MLSATTAPRARSTQHSSKTSATGPPGSWDARNTRQARQRECAREDLDELLAANRTGKGHLYAEVGVEPIWLNQDPTNDNPDRRAGREYRAGERIMIRVNARKLGVNNGDTMTIVGLEGDDLIVRKDNGTTVTIPPDTGETTLRKDLHHAYASTIHKSQRHGTERSSTCPSRAGWDRKLLYVAASRGRVEKFLLRRR